jgi:hypothetical protein
MHFDAFAQLFYQIKASGLHPNASFGLLMRATDAQAAMGTLTTGKSSLSDRSLSVQSLLRGRG